MAGDGLLLLASLWMALSLRAGNPPEMGYFMIHLQIFVFLFLFSILVFFVAGLYEKQARLIKRIIGIRVLGAQLATTLIAAVAFFVLPVGIAPKTILGLYLLISVTLISTWRFFVVPALSFGHKTRALLIGSGSEMDEVHAHIRGNQKYSIEFSSYIDSRTDGLVARIENALTSDVSLVVLDTKDPALEEHLPALYAASFSHVRLIEFSDFYEGVFDRVSLSHLDQSWLIENSPERTIVYDVSKATFDRVGAFLGLIIAAFFIIPALIVVKMSGGRAFIYQPRIGRGGKPFNVIKLRTMLLDDKEIPELQAKNRVTRIGWFLRKSRIDELPQLVNILKGDLSFIGPRPERPQIASVYEAEIPYYSARHLVTPGLSGWAQIYHLDAPRGGADIERTRVKLSYDLFYLKYRSFGLDIAVALKTIRALTSFSGT